LWHYWGFHSLAQATVQLAQDQYGNYVIQHVVEQGKPHERDAVYERLFPHIVVLSQNKFASNVVEKMLLHCSAAERAAIVEEFLRQSRRSSNGDGIVVGKGCEQSALEQMMQDQYGNYVVQKTLEVGTPCKQSLVEHASAVGLACMPSAIVCPLGACKRC
jgi:pumilio RNA-binding family